MLVVVLSEVEANRPGFCVTLTPPASDGDRTEINQTDLKHCDLPNASLIWEFVECEAISRPPLQIYTNQMLTKMHRLHLEWKQQFSHQKAATLVSALSFDGLFWFHFPRFLLVTFCSYFKIV